jgi:hypothetical protein
VKSAAARRGDQRGVFAARVKAQALAREREADVEPHGPEKDEALT